MATHSRAALIERTIKVLKKHFKPVVVAAKDRTLFEHLIFACLLEDSPQEAAEQVFQTLKSHYFGWNEVRVSTIRELADALKTLVHPPEAAARLKSSLQSVFESVYEFDIEGLRKQNIGQAVKQLQKYRGTTPFMVAYVTQHALGGHSIPVNDGALVALHTVGVISDEEFANKLVPGLERAVPKTKGVEIGSLLHQLGVEVGRNPYGQQARKLMLEIDPHCKDRLPKRVTRRPESEAAPPPPTSPASKPKKPETEPAGKKPAARGTAAPKEAEKTKPKSGSAKPAGGAKKPLPTSKKPTKKAAKKPTIRKLAKRKPR